MTTGDDRDAVLLAALLSGTTYEEAAEAAGTSASTVYRRMGDSAFRGRLQRLRAEVLGRATDRLAAVTHRAVDALAEILDDPDAALGHRVAAARTILDQALRYRQDIELEARLAAVEAALDARKDTT